MKSFSFSLAMLVLLLAACGKSIDKNSFEGRVASAISAHEGVNMAVSVDLKSIIEKSGMKDGAIPDQYLATVKPYMEALEASVNLDKQVFMLPLLDATNPSNNGSIILFDIKDLNRLKKEFKEMGLNLQKKGNMEFDAKDKEAAGIFKEQTGFIILADNGNKLDASFMEALAKSLDAGETVEGVVDYVNLKADMTVFSTGEKAQKLQKSGLKEMDELVAKMSELGKGSYAIGQMNFNNQEAVMTFDMEYGKAMRKYLPLMRDNISNEGKSVILSNETFIAFAMNMDFEKIMNFILDNLDDKTKDELNKNLGMMGGTEKFKKLISGEMAMSVSKGAEEPTVNVFLGSGDKKQLQSLLDSFGFFLGLKKSGNGYQMDNGYMMVTDKGAFIAQTKEQAEKMIASKTATIRTMGDFKFGAASASAFVDFKILSSIPGMDEFSSVWKDMDFATMESNNKGFKLVLKSTKANQNILRTIVEAVVEGIRVNEIEEEKRRKEYEAMWGDESEWEDEDLNYAL